MKFEKGDWVRGRSYDGELIHGFIEDIDTVQNIMKVYVIKSDNEIIIGKTFWILNKYAEKLALTSSSSENEILTLIDIALQTNDKKWFIELSERLKVSKRGTNKKASHSKFSMNRLENIDTKQ